MNNVREYIISELSKINVHNIVIIDWGSGNRWKRAERYIQHKDCEIINVDIEPANSPSLVADMCKPLTIKEADIAFCLETLEHCYNPDVVLDNIYNNLKIAGKLYISVPFVTSLHGRRDYWRFTKLGISTLLKRHKFKIISVVQKKHEQRIGYFIVAIK
ncbi:MAG: methyltransferase domain-containing protein [Candidatus Daviesbacteria bacterium]|nr:methyltransferase domain-containing protein [Candidatus Daviesbacteria bacterium]